MCPVPQVRVGSHSEKNFSDFHVTFDKSTLLSLMQFEEAENSVCSPWLAALFLIETFTVGLHR